MIKKGIWVLLMVGLGGNLSQAKAQGKILPKEIQSAVAYVESRGADFLPDVQLMVFWLARKYDLPLSEAWREQVQEMIRQPQWNESELRYYFRVVDPEYSVSVEALDKATGFNWLTAKALYCDVYPLPSTFGDSLKVYNRGSYDCTHSAFAYWWALEKGCISADSLVDFEDELTHGLIAVIEGRGADVDVGIEAMAMLLQMGKRDKLQPHWITETMLNSQRPDGSWSEKPSVDQSNDHTTALALWVMLEWFYPETPSLPWVDKRKENKE